MAANPSVRGPTGHRLARGPRLRPRGVHRSRINALMRRSRHLSGRRRGWAALGAVGILAATAIVLVPRGAAEDPFGACLEADACALRLHPESYAELARANASLQSRVGADST